MSFANVLISEILSHTECDFSCNNNIFGNNDFVFSIVTLIVVAMLDFKMATHKKQLHISIKQSLMSLNYIVLGLSLQRTEVSSLHLYWSVYGRSDVMHLHRRFLQPVVQPWE